MVTEGQRVLKVPDPSVPPKLKIGIGSRNGVGVKRRHKRITAKNPRIQKVFPRSAWLKKRKGLGAEHVFMIGLIEGVIPNRAKGNDTIKSQRRLFYVGMTRAKKALHLISSISIEGKHVNTVNKDDFKFDVRSRIWKGKASRLIEEINK